MHPALTASLWVSISLSGIDAQVSMREFLVIARTLPEVCAKTSQIVLSRLAGAWFTFRDTPFGEWIRLGTLLGRVSLLDSLFIIQLRMTRLMAHFRSSNINFLAIFHNLNSAINIGVFNNTLSMTNSWILPRLSTCRLLFSSRVSNNLIGPIQISHELTTRSPIISSSWNNVWRLSTAASGEAHIEILWVGGTVCVGVDV